MIEEALSRPDAANWRAAIISEYCSLTHKKTWTLQKRANVPKDQKILRGKLVFKTKRGKDSEILKHKVRWVVRGFEQQYGRDYDQTFAGVCKSTTWKIAVALAALYDYEIEQMDAVTAFLNSEMDGEVYVELPPGWAECGIRMSKEMVCKLLKALYGLKQAPRLWQEKLRKELKKLGFEPLKADQCIYRNEETGVIVVTYVDDFLIIGKKGPKIDNLKEDLQATFKMEDLGPASYFVGVRIVRDRENKTVSLCQDAYIKKILKKYGMEKCKAAPTPMASGAAEFMVPFNGEATKQDITLYQSMVGSLMYLAVHTRADIAFTVSVLSRFLMNPSPQHIKAAQRVFCYLQGTIYLAVVLGGDGDNELHGYSDSDFAGCLHT